LFQGGESLDYTKAANNCCQASNLNLPLSACLKLMVVQILFDLFARTTALMSYLFAKSIYLQDNYRHESKSIFELDSQLAWNVEIIA